MLDARTLAHLDGASASAAAIHLQCGITPWSAGDAAPVDDLVLEETPVALVYNGISHAVMLASPIDLEDFAIGFSLTEGIVDSTDEIYDIDEVPSCEGIALHLRIASSRMAALKLRRRALTGRTGCGLCGVESLAQAVQPVRAVSMGGRIGWPAVELALSVLAGRQALHQATGAAHAAAFVGWNGEMKLLREAVGRHNALDILVGAMAKDGSHGDEGFALVTSRASYEMVHKTAAAGIRVLVALSAPTGLAVRAAQEAGVTLIGFAGRRRPLVYSHAERIEGH
ncbi:MAG: formate dehydrogenase accessory sulfurtransferase FdhD [Gammaproteobacteria bacterium]|nr:formate dehydrogenase accessory sulfurtransferase FdhD [Gammaproteobacteria bacterium]MBU1441617.1 formate dehydrogenase accessory sulfurtransferase FdhD [Gammaproteobacteria bacterium]